MIRRVIAVVFASALVLALSAQARGDELAERTQAVIDALRGGDVPEAVRLLEAGDTAQQIGASPALAHVLADRAYRFEELGRASPPAARRTLAELVQSVAEEALTAAGEDHRSHWALAQACVLRERTTRSEGAAAWQRAAALLLSAHGVHPGDGEALGYAVTFLLEGACVVPDGQYELRKEASRLAETALTEFPENAGLAATIASVQVWAARTLAASNRKLAKSLLKDAQSSLRPHVRRDAPDRRAADIWNASVTLDRAAGFALREKYSTVTAEALGGSLRFDVPISSRWSVTEVAGTDDQGAYVYVTETDAVGSVLRQLLFRRYTWGWRYRFDGPNDVNGDEVKNIARGLQGMSAERVFATGAERPAVKKTRIGDDLVGHGFEVRGETNDEEPRPLVLRGACVRGSRQESLAVLIYVYAADGELGQEMQAVVDSLRESDS